MKDNSICRIGVFYDGCYFTYARNYFYHRGKLGWLEFRPFHAFVETFIRNREQGYNHYRVVYAAWFQGIFSSNKAEMRQLKNERNLLHDLMHAGIEPKYMPMPLTGQSEKGSDVALAVDAMQIGLAGKIDIAVLVTGDADFVPLARALMKEGIRVMGAYFEYDDDRHKSFINERLDRVCNYTLNINDAQKNRELKALFKGLFRRADEQRMGNTPASIETRLT
jgi:uncharacterized LabA/DUF88 family protein